LLFPVATPDFTSAALEKGDDETLCLLVDRGRRGGVRRPAGAQYYSPENGISIRAGIYTPNAEASISIRCFATSPAIPRTSRTARSASSTSLPRTAVDLLIGGSFFETTAPGVPGFRGRRGLLDRARHHARSLNFEVGLRIKLAPRHSPVVPYIGGGGDGVRWQLTEEGDFIDFNPPPAEIFSDRFEAEGTTVGYFLVAGLDIPIGRDFAIFVEGRWREAEDDLSDDSKISASSTCRTEVTGGVTWRF
jgi:hypothetical protein